MSQMCQTCTAYLDRTLDEAARLRFEEHLAGCVRCKVEVEHWHEIANTMREVVASQASDALRVALPSPQQFVRRATRREPPRSARPWFVWALAPAMAAAAVLIAVKLRAPGATDLLIDDEPVETAWIESGGKLRHVQLGRDTIDLEPDSKLALLEVDDAHTVLALRRGTAALSVDSSHGKRDFKVRAGDLAEVRVTGTKFTVHATDELVEVGVSEGVVVVTRGGGEDVVLRAGEHTRVERPAQAEPAPGASPTDIMAQTAEPRDEPATDTESASEDVDADETPATSARRASTRAPESKASAHSAKPNEKTRVKKHGPAKETAAHYDAWMQAAGGGKCSTVIAVMNDRVAYVPADTRTWSLLGDCQRKEKHWADAVDAYKQVIAHGDTVAAQRARYFAAEIQLDALDAPKSAIGYLRAYLAAPKQSDALDRVARLRLGRAHVQTGDKATARHVLGELVESYPSSREAREANELLEAIGR